MRYFMKILLCLATLFSFTALSLPPDHNSGLPLMAAEKHMHGQSGEECEECKEGHGSSEQHPYKKEKAGDATALPEVHSGLDHEDGEDCQTCSDFYAEPWRNAGAFSGWMQVKTYKVLLFALLCYIYLKRRALLDSFKRKAKNCHE